MNISTSTLINIASRQSPATASRKSLPDSKLNAPPRSPRYHFNPCLHLFPQMAGKATGERIPGRKYRQIVEAASRGDSINLISRNVKVTWHTVKAVVERESREIAERKQELLDQSLRIARCAANRIEDTIDEANLSQANFVYGTATDKIGQLSGDPALIIRHEHAHLHAHKHSFQPITRENWNQLLDQLPDDDPPSTLSTPIVPSLSPPEQQDNTDDANAAAAALPAA